MRTTIFALAFIASVVAKADGFQPLPRTCNAWQAQRCTTIVEAARIINKVTPRYPSAALSRRHEGTVRIHISIDDRGRVLRTAVLSGDSLLAGAAEHAASQWRFRAPRLKYRAVPSEGVLTFNFSLPEP
jgi:TonB family protein